MKIKKTTDKIKIKMVYGEYKAYCHFLELLLGSIPRASELNNAEDLLVRFEQLNLSSIYNKELKSVNCPLRNHHQMTDDNTSTLTFSEALTLWYSSATIKISHAMANKLTYELHKQLI